MTLDQLPCGRTAEIARVKGEFALACHLMQLGFTPGNPVIVVRRYSPGGALQAHLKGTDFALSRDAARCIELGTDKKAEHSLPQIIPRTDNREKAFTQVALVGNQNSGKSTLFNALTGSSQRVGNFPGVTVERKSGTIRGTSLTLTDLPGAYSLSAYTTEEGVTADFLRENRPAVLNVIETSNLERSLSLTLELIELNLPMVIALNMMDEVENEGGRVDITALSQRLGVKVVPISAAKNRGMDDLTDALFKAMPSRVCVLGTGEQKRAFCRELAKQTLHLPRHSRRYQRSRVLDKILTGTISGLLFLVLILGGVFWLTFSAVGPWLSGALAYFLEWLGSRLNAAFIDWEIRPILRLLLMNGIWQGICTVLSFLPTVLVLFFCLSLLEDSGYLARIAFLLDGLLRPLGLSGLSAVPLLLGFGCTVPAALACRTLPGERQRRNTLRLLPFMSCGAKLPVYFFFAQMIFPEHPGRATFLIYLLGMVLAIPFSLAMKEKETMSPLVLEMPNYRLPTLKNTLMLIRRKGGDFLQRVFTVVFLASMATWLLQNFDWSFHLTSPENSILAQFAGMLVPCFAPLGLGDWRIITALLTGIFAKETVLSTLAVLMGENAQLRMLLPQPAGAALLVFCLLYPPCVAALAAVRREAGTGEALKMTARQCVLAWTAAFLVYCIFGAT